jgi:Leucine-rich repeat (LRR) protein
LHTIQNKFKNKNLQVISITDLNIDSLPFSITQLKQLKKLHLDNTSLEFIPEGFFQLKNLKSFHLYSFNLEKRRYPFFQLKSLKHLTLRHGYTGGAEIQFPSNLISLNLGETGLEEIHPSIFELKNLQYLSIDGNCFDSISYKIKNLSQLKTLSISRNKSLKELCPSIRNMSQLQHLDIAHLPLIKSLPDNFFSKLGQLKALEIDFYRGKIPTSVKNLTDLEYLSANYTNWSREAIEVLLSFLELKHLRLQGNGIKNLPSDFYKLTDITSLDFTDNSFDSFPKMICNLSKLQTLKIGNVKASRKLNSYKILKGNIIKTLPLELTKLKKLTSLFVLNCQLESLPASLCELRNLKELYIHNNPISELPKNIGNLKKLKYLNIRGTQIKQLPESFKELKNLKKLTISKHQIRNLKAVLPEGCEVLTY